MLQTEVATIDSQLSCDESDILNIPQVLTWSIIEKKNVSIKHISVEAKLPQSFHSDNEQSIVPARQLRSSLTVSNLIRF